MRIFEGENLDEVYVGVVKAVQSMGSRTESRLGPTIDIGAVAVKLSGSRVKLLANKGRAINPGLAIVEACWVLSGQDRVAPLSTIAPRFEDFSDDGKVLSGAYGFRLRQRFGFDQIEGVIEHLRRDPNSRRCFGLIAQPEDSRSTSLDVPCNIGIMFRISGDAVDMTVINRSNDVIFGLPYDIFTFSLLQFTVADALCRPVGQHLHISNSMHFYCKNVDLVERAIAARSPVLLPADAEAAEFLRVLVRNARAIGAMELGCVNDGMVQALVRACLPGGMLRGGLDLLPEEHWLANLVRAWWSRGAVSSVASTGGEG